MRRIHIDQEQLRQLIETEKMQQRQVAQKLGISKGTILRACKRFGIKTQRTGPRGGPGHPAWRGGRHMHAGYIRVWRPDHPNANQDGYVTEHRLVMSEHLGRPLLRQEVVHHMDGNPENNDISNLQIFATNAEHLRHELTGNVPNHSPEGMERMRARGQQTATRRRLAVLCGAKNIQMTVPKLDILAQAALVLFESPTRPELLQLLSLSRKTP